MIDIFQTVNHGLDIGFSSRFTKIDWTQIYNNLNTNGWAITNEILGIAEIQYLIKLYQHDEIFRSHIIMAKYGFGRGEYKYFKYPLPDIVNELRRLFYNQLAPIANQWNGLMGIDIAFPDNHDEFLDQCHKAGQVRPTPLLLQYGKDDYNCLHQDVYGENIFPLQVVFLLSEPGTDFQGGELVLTEQRPRMQSKPIVVPLRKGDAVIFAVRHRPVQGNKGTYRVSFRHGVSKVYSGERHTLGVIFHDAK